MARRYGEAWGDGWKERRCAREGEGEGGRGGREDISASGVAGAVALVVAEAAPRGKIRDCR